jgi:hypothetical protein
VCLGDLEVGLEVLLLEGVELRLVVHRLTLISIDDSLHHSLTSLQVVDRLDVVVGEFKLSSVLEDPFETRDFEVSAFEVSLEVLDFFLEAELFEINFGGVAEVDGPLEEAVEDGDVGLANNLRASGEAQSQTVKIGSSGHNEFKVAWGGIGFSHLGDKLFMVLEEEFDVSRLGVWLVAEEWHEVLEGFGQVIWAVVFERLINPLDDDLGDQTHVRGTVGFEGNGAAARLHFTLKLLFLSNDVGLQGLNERSFSVSFLLHGIEVLIEGHLLTAKAVDFDVNVALHSLGVVAVAGLELGHVEESLLALVTLLSDEVEKLFLAHAVKHFPNFLVWTHENMTRKLGFGRQMLPRIQIKFIRPLRIKGNLSSSFKAFTILLLSLLQRHHLW